MRSRPIHSVLIATSAAAVVLLGSLPALAGDYLKDVKPLLAEKCAFCHGPLQQEAGLRLDAAALIVGGGDSGSVVDVENPAGSLILERITSQDEFERMPPEGEGEPLNDKEVGLIRAWIAAGAPVPEDEEILSGPGDHWAYRPIQRPEPPKVDRPDWSAHPVDRFIAARHERLGLTPVELAEKPVLLRRVHLDLIGLPPTPEEMQAFLDDDAADAYERVVDRLLESPHYGERWGRHWMDVWRYSDWNGYRQEVRGSQRHIWRWRDWIVEALNADKGYDRMIREMLAADEIAPDDPDALRATGYLVRNYHNKNRDVWLDAVVEHTAKAFLGITMECARCHDHKYDPIPQVDYFRFRAIFEPHDVRTDRIPGERDLVQDGLPRAYDAWPERETVVYEAGDERRPLKDDPVSPGIPEFFGGALPIEPVPLPVEGWTTELREFIEREELAVLEAKLKNSEAERNRLQEDADADETAREQAELKLAADQLELASLEARWGADKAKHLGLPENADTDQLARDASRLEREFKAAAAELALFDKQQAVAQLETSEDEKDREKKLEEARKAADKASEELDKARAALDEEQVKYTPVGKLYPQTSTGRRTALANWIASPENPLTARVAVNHVWLRHFGRPLVPNVVDFGLSTPRPPHADLLDWLATELTSHSGAGWSLKHLHRLIVTSRTYRLASSADETAAANLETDPENVSYWRRHPLRLEAEIVRDAVLAAAGSLDTQLGGADIDYAEGEKVPRRSIYFRTAYEKQMQLLTLFDMASPNECYRRSESVIPQQALAIANSPLTVTQSRKLARRLWEQVREHESPDEAFVTAVFERILSRGPTAEELGLCLTFLEEQSQRLASPEALTPIEGGPKPQLAPSDDPHLRARENLVHAIFNHNDFVTVR